jgi:hypothetical protein
MLLWSDLAGLVGVAAIVGAYLLMQVGRVTGQHAAYSAVNAVGAALVMVSLIYRFNLSAFLVEAFWVVISVVGFARRFGKA